MNKKEYWLHHYYDLVIKLIDKCRLSEEQIHNKMRDSIEEGGVMINSAISAINDLARTFGIDWKERINVDEVISKREQRTDLTNFKSKDELDEFIKSEVPRFVKKEHVSKGNLFKRNKDFEKAKEFYQKALDIDYHDLTLIRDFYEVLIKLGEFETAKFWLNRHLEEEHNWMESWALKEKAYLFLRQNNKPKVFDILKTLLQKSPNNIKRIVKDSRFNEVVKTEEFKLLITPIKEFKVNNYIRIIQTIGGFSLHIGDQRKIICSNLKLINPYAEEYFHSFEDIPEGYENLKKDDEFWGLCSCLQAWAENNYNCDFLHESLSLFLLDELCKLGDPLATKVFSQEIAKMLKNGDYHIQEYLRTQGYLSHLTQEELIKGSLNSPDSEILLELSKNSSLEYSVIGNFDEDGFRRGYLTKNYHYSLIGGYVIELELELNRVNSRIPALLNKLKYLKQLYLYVINVNPVFNRIDSLTHLEIRTNGHVILPDTFDSFPKLKKLFILKSRRGYGSTSFEKTPESICILKDLNWLRIDNVELKVLPSTFGDLKNLDWLIINGTGLESLPESIYELENLESITIENNPLKIPVKLKNLEYKFAEKIYEKINESMPDGMSFNALKKVLKLPDYKIWRGLSHLRDRITCEKEYLSNTPEDKELPYFIKKKIV